MKIGRSLILSVLIAWTSLAGAPARTFSDADWVSMSEISLDAYEGVGALAINSNGDLYAGGRFSKIGSYASSPWANNIAKWNGSEWSPLGVGVDSEVMALALDSAGNVYAGGYFTDAGGVTVNAVAKWNGTAWSALGSGMDGAVFALAVDGAGNVYAGGSFTTAGGVPANRVAKWNGTSWSALGSGMSGAGPGMGDAAPNPVEALVLDGAGNLYAGGLFGKAGGVQVNSIAKWDGTKWSALGTGMNGWVRALALDSAGNLFAAGYLTKAGGVAVNHIAKWNGKVWSALGAGTDGGINALSFDRSGNLFAGGSFLQAGGVTANRIAKWNGISWSAMGTGVDNVINALAVDQAGDLFAGGKFKRAGREQACGIAKACVATGAPARPLFALEEDGGWSVERGATVSFGAVKLGQTKTLRLWIANTGSAALEGIRVEVPSVTSDIPHKSSGLHLASAPPASVAALSGRASFEVSFTPLEPGTRSGFISVWSNDPDRSPFTFRISAVVDSAEGVAGRSRYDQGEPADEEQDLMEELNRARANPTQAASDAGLGDLNEGIAPGSISAAPKHPLVFHPALLKSSRKHSRWMMENDIFWHTGANGSSPFDRMRAAGYPFSGAGENIAFSGGIFRGAGRVFNGMWMASTTGHRQSMLNPAWIEVGLGIWPVASDDPPPTPSYFANFYGTENFAFRSPSQAPFVTGVVYEDKNANGLYDMGEGVGGVSIVPDSGKYYAVTSRSGGYAVPIPAGTTPLGVTFGGAISDYWMQVQRKSSSNVKLDLILPVTATRILSLEGNLDFGHVAVTSLGGLRKPLRIRNDGSGALTVTGISLPGGFSADAAFPFTVKPHASVEVGIRFSPAAAGVTSGQATIAANQTSGNASLACSGTGVTLPADAATLVVGRSTSVSLATSLAQFGSISGITGLPPGLRFAAGVLTGSPTSAGIGSYTILSRNSLGAVTSILVPYSVEPIPAHAVGSFTALLEPANAPSQLKLPDLGGLINLTASSAGAYSGTLRLGKSTWSFRGQIEALPGSSNPEGTVRESIPIITNSRDTNQNITLALEFRPEDHATLPGLTGNLTFLGTKYPIGPGWQHVWNATKNPAFGNKDRTLNVAIINTGILGPQGSGFATIKLTKAGLTTWAATLSDGLKVTGSFTASPDGDVPFYAPIPYPNGGAVYALLATDVSGDFRKVSDTPRPNGRWIKLQTTDPKKADRLYRGGFDANLDISGAEHRAPAPGQLLFGNRPAPGALSLTLGGAGINTSAQLGSADPLSRTSQLLAGNKITVNNKITVDNADLPTTVKFVPTFSATTGILSGTVSLSDANPLGGTAKIPRTLAYTGLYIPDLESPADSAIYGFFTLPELPKAAGETISNTPIQSGRILISTP